MQGFGSGTSGEKHYFRGERIFFVVMKKYKHIFFDLDRTIWDFEKNAAEAYHEIYEKHKLQAMGIKSLEDFTKSYLKHNEALWDLYRAGKIEKEYLRSRRFEVTLLDFGIDNRELAEQIGMDYVTISPQKTNLFPNSMEILEYLSARYPLHIITNGFEEVQFSKLKNCRLDHFFTRVITSEAAGHKKPDRRIFDFALQKVGTTATESLMIGDDYEVDILGATAAGMDAVYFNPRRLSHNGKLLYEIFDLIELKHFL